MQRWVLFPLALLKIPTMFKSATPNGHAIHDQPIGFVTRPIGFSEPIRFSEDLMVERNKALYILGQDGPFEFSFHVSWSSIYRIDLMNCLFLKVSD